MIHYIDMVNTWKPANRKCLEVQSLAQEYRRTLIPDEDAAEELVKELRAKVEELNGLYPKTKRLAVLKSGGFIYCASEGPADGDRYVFTFRIVKARQVYKTLETMADENVKGGEE